VTQEQFGLSDHSGQKRKVEVSQHRRPGSHPLEQVGNHIPISWSLDKEGMHAVLSELLDYRTEHTGIDALMDAAASGMHDHQRPIRWDTNTFKVRPSQLQEMGWRSFRALDRAVVRRQAEDLQESIALVSGLQF
jgi:hypothetical protein